jgi:uncharacterized protein YdgA (DUF945 family)
MNRLVTVVIVMAVVLVGAPWVIGNVAEQRVNRGLDALTGAAPYLGIVERKYSQGWFRSEQEVTFELLGPLGAGATPEHAAIERTQPGIGTSAPTRFTVRSEILHGPVLGLSGFGLARVNSRLVLDDVDRAWLVETFGTDEPVRVSTKVGFLGGGTTTFSGDARSIKLPGGNVAVSWDDFELDIDYSGDLDSFTLSGDCDRFETRDAAAKNRLVVRGMELAGSSERIRGKLYDSDLEFGIDEISYLGEDEAQTTTKDVRFVMETAEDGDFVNIATRMGSGPIESPELAARGLALESTHNDFTLRRLHGDSLEKFLAAIDASYAGDSPATLAEVHAQGLALFGHDPELVIDRFGIEAADGTAYLKGIIRLKGVTEKDLKMGALSLIARLDADLRFEAPQKLLEKMAGSPQAVTQALEEGFAERQGAGVATHLEFHAGELKINGKIQGIPGLGAPPPGPE